jgi:hypothetical protein
MGIVGGLLAVVQLTGAVRPVDLLSPALHGQGSDVIVTDFGASGIRQEDPYDGQYIYVTARLLPDLDAVTDAIRESDFRLVRILHPLLASPAPPGNATVFLLQLWNVLGVGLFVGAMADLLQRHGCDPRWAAAGAVACVFSIQYTTSEPLAFGLAMAGLALLDRDRLVGATALLALGGLTRETALTFAVAGALLLVTRRRRLAAGAVLAVASLPTAAWWAYVQSITERSRVPAGLLGILDLPDLWAPNIAASLVVLGLTVVSVAAWWDVPVFRWLALGFAAWIPLYERYSFTVAALPRLTIPSVALGLAGLARWRLRTPAAPPDVSQSDGRGGRVGTRQPLR